MKKFKTNIKCAACVAKVTPGLNEVVGEGKWKVDLTHPDRILTIENEVDVNAKLKEVGYSAEDIN
ncbi:MAG: heavy metal transport/detoxification protein [Cyclobacteriaceae bacterium]|nr:heavy metal transport/detoxification protein [Cyclobacteriaceae bacterium]